MSNLTCFAFIDVLASNTALKAHTIIRSCSNPAMKHFLELLSITNRCPSLEQVSPRRFVEFSPRMICLRHVSHFKCNWTEPSESRCWNWASIRLIRLCCFGILFPILCIVLPIYARYVLYAESLVPLAASDMRLVDGKMSTTWCQVINYLLILIITFMKLL